MQTVFITTFMCVLGRGGLRQKMHVRIMRGDWQTGNAHFRSRSRFDVVNLLRRDILGKSQLKHTFKKNILLLLLYQTWQQYMEKKQSWSISSIILSFLCDIFFFSDHLIYVTYNLICLSEMFINKSFIPVKLQLLD